MQKKIRNHTKDKIPFQLIAGAEDQQSNSVSFRYRSGDQVNGVAVDEAIALILHAIKTKRQV
jgi:threonyl-tRNA synthetase